MEKLSSRETGKDQNGRSIEEWKGERYNKEMEKIEV